MTFELYTYPSTSFSSRGPTEPKRAWNYDLLVPIAVAVVAAVAIGIILCKAGDASRYVSCSSRISQPSSNVHAVDSDDDFKNTVSKLGSCVAMFHAPWCGHCKHMKPIVESVAAERPHIHFVFVDGNGISTTVHKENGVDGYPTLISYKNGKATQYEGEREADKIGAWCENAMAN